MTDKPRLIEIAQDALGVEKADLFRLDSMGGLMSKNKITRLPVVERSRELNLEVVHYDPKQPCQHRGVSFRLHEGEAEVECGGCGVRLEAMFVLRQLAHEESRWKTNREAFVVAQKKLQERVRTKCQHCGQMTRIRGL